MQKETLVGSFILRVLNLEQRRQYSLQNLRTGEILTFSSSAELFRYVESSSGEHPPWKLPEGDPD
ncbi:MAG: hypothetical protein KC422_09250 [Trueperaceae bacterium]|nr:hypothetical protein [Trueperaceae bacterium]